ncbi:MAG: SDR family NAD(P)-dependent oxidoreductase [Gammaproteobacteria bacterium]
MTKRFSGRLVLITGAAGGMGQAFAARFAEEGAELILTDVEEDGLAKAASALREQGAKCSTFRVDLASEPGIRGLAGKLCAAHPRLDVLLNNAGLAYGEVAHSFETLSQEKWLRYLAVNTVAPLLLAQALRPSLAAAKGVVLNISSMASAVPGTAYGVTKAALNAMTYGMASAFGGDGIRVNAIAPGIMETAASRSSLPPETYARIQGQQMLSLNGTADDIAALALFLASDDARFISNEIVHCDAGNRLRGWRV